MPNEFQYNLQATTHAHTGDGRDDLGNESVQVGISRTLHVKVAPTHVIDGFVVNHEGAVGVLQSGVSGQDTVVRLNNSG